MQLTETEQAAAAIATAWQKFDRHLSAAVRGREDAVVALTAVVKGGRLQGTVKVEKRVTEQVPARTI